MQNYNIPVRLVMLGKKQVDVLRELHSRRIKVTAPQFSVYVNGVENTPKSELVLAEADKILTEWEGKQRA